MSRDPETGERPMKHARSDSDGFALPSALPSAGDAPAAPGTAVAAPVAPLLVRGRWDSIGANFSSTRQAAMREGMTPTPVAVAASGAAGAASGNAMRRLWDQGATPTPRAVAGSVGGGAHSGLWDRAGATPSGSADGRWGATPLSSSGAFGQTPVAAAFGRTPVSQRADGDGAAGESGFVDSRFGAVDASVVAGLGGGDGAANARDVAAEFAALPQREQLMLQRVIEAQRYMTDEQIDGMMPPGYTLVPVPADIAAKATATETGSAALADAGPATGGAAEGAAGVDAAVAAAARRIDLPVDGVVADDLPPLRVEDAAVFQLLIEYRHLHDSELPPEHARRVHALRSLLKFKNGNPRQRRMGSRDLVTRARHYGVDAVVQPLVTLWRSDGILSDDLDRHRVVKLLAAVLMQFRDALDPASTRNVLVLLQPLLQDQDRATREESRELMCALIKAAGFTGIVAAVKRDMLNASIEARRAASETLAVVAETLGVEKVARLLDTLARTTLADEESENYKMHTCVNAVHGIAASRVGAMCRLHLPLLMNVCNMCLRSTREQVRAQAAYSITAVADAVRPHGYEAFLGTLLLLREGCASANRMHIGIVASAAAAATAAAAEGRAAPPLSATVTRSNNTVARALAGYLRALGSIMMLMPPREQREQADAIKDPLQRCFAATDPELRRSSLRVVDQLLACEGVSAEFVREYLLVGFLQCWTVLAISERRNVRQLLDTTVIFARKVAGPLILATLRERLEQDAPQLPPDHVFSRAVVEGICSVAERGGATLAAVVDDELRATFEALVEALLRDRAGTCTWVVQAIAVFCREAGPRMLILAPKLIRTVSARLGDRVPAVRRQAAILVAQTARTIGDNAPGAIDALRDAWTDLDERIVKEHNVALDAGGGGDDGADNDGGGRGGNGAGSLVSAALRACCALLEAWCLSGGRHLREQVVIEAEGHATKLLAAVQAALKAPSLRGDDALKEQCVRAVACVVGLCERDIAVASPDSLFTVAVENLLLLLDARRRTTRTLTAQAFGKVANLIGPLHIIRKLVERGLRRDDKQHRVCAAVALAVVAKACRPFVVVPFLVFEYEQSRGTELAITIQHAVLKALRFLFEHIAGEPDAVPCVHAVLPLLERALTERQLQHRRMACEAVREMMLACAGGVDADGAMRPVWVHLLNFVLPTLLEPVVVGKEQRRSVSTVVEVLEAARLVLPPAAVLQLLEQGMFHPARFIRDVYWGAYNTLAVGAGEALVAAYPPVGGDDEHEGPTYRRHLLEVVV
jgi:splicing factor 3B subunit 1